MYTMFTVIVSSSYLVFVFCVSRKLELRGCRFLEDTVSQSESEISSVLKNFTHATSRAEMDKAVGAWAK
jgi:hypothetical protein